MNNKIPFLDLIQTNREMEEELLSIFRHTLTTGMFIGGPMVEAFEKDFAFFCRTERSVGVGSGTDALRFALIAAGIKPGDIVVTVPYTFIATTEAISQAGAFPAFVDIDPVTYTMDPQKLQEFLTEECRQEPRSGRTIHRKSDRPVTGVIPVHLYGQMADMDPLTDLAEQYRLILIEDACQAHGAEYFSKKENTWKKAGSVGKAAAFSFYPGKNLGACGEAGAITTGDQTIAEKARMLRDHGQLKKYVHEIEGYNGRLDALQAGILQIKLRRLPGWNEQRRNHAARYNELLGGIEGIVTPHVPEWSVPVWHLYTIRIEKRNELREFLGQKNIATGLHYPIPLHLQQAYAAAGYRRGDFPASEQAAEQILSLPMFPELTGDQQFQVVENIKQFVSPAPGRLISTERTAPMNIG